LPRHRIQVFCGLFNGLRLESEPALASSPHATHDSGTLQHSEMFCDGLTRQFRAVSELRNRAGPPARKASDEGQAGLGPESGEYWSVIFPGKARAMPFVQYRPPRFSSARSSRRRFSETPQAGALAGSCRSPTPSVRAACRLLSFRV